MAFGRVLFIKFTSILNLLHLHSSKETNENMNCIIARLRFFILAIFFY